MMNKTRILLLITLLLTMQYGAKAQSEPDIIWHTPGISADFLVLSPDGQYVYANRGDSKLGNVFSQLRVDDGTIIRKDINTIGHIGGFSVDGLYVFAINPRISNMIYKADAETLEKVDSLEIPDTRAFHFLSYAMSYDRKYLYLGTVRGQADAKNFYVVDTQTMEVLHGESYLKVSAAKPHHLHGEILGIYPSPNNDYVAIYVSVNAFNNISSWLPVVDVRDNFKTVNSDLEYTSDIGSAAFSLDKKKLFATIGGSAFTGGIKKTLVYNTPTFILIDSLVFPSHPQRGGGSSSVIPSLINPNIMYIGTTLPTIEGYRDCKLHIIDAENVNEKCFVESKAENYFQFIPTYILADNETNIIAFNLVVTNAEVEGIYKFRNCTPTGIQDDKNTIQTLQVIDNKLTIPLEAKKGVMLNYQISDIRGVMLTQQSLISSSNDLVIDVHHLVPGTYFLTLQILNDTVNYKFIIIR